MFSKEEEKELRGQFWNTFLSLSRQRRLRKKLPGNWILNQTGVKALNLKFHVDQQGALVGIDLETRNMDKRIELFEKLESLKKILEKAMGGPMIWELDYTRENGKSISRIYQQMEGVSLYDQSTWPAAHEFMYKKMMNLEDFYREYRDYFKYA